MHHAGLSDGGESQPGSTCALAGLQYIARASPEEGQGQSLEVAQQKLPTSERIYHASRRTTLAKKNHAVVFVEDLSIRNRSKSETGSQENHGTNVKQKSGLNRETRRNSLPSGPSESGGSQEMVEMPAVLSTESPSLPPPVDRSRRYTRILVILFLCTVPLVNPIVHGDGVGYYAYVRAPLIEQSLDLTRDYQYANPSFRHQRVDESGQPNP